MKDYWVAEFVDGSVLNQFDGDIENRFSLIEENISDLKSFKLYVGKEVYEVNISESFIYEKSHKKIVEGNNPILIYFRRRTMEIDTVTKKVLSSNVVHHIGIKTDVDEQVITVNGDVSE